MILFVLNGDGSTLKEKLSSTSASYKFLNLYGKNLALAWPDSEVENIRDPSIEIVVKTKRSYVLAGNEWKKDPTKVNVGKVEIGGKKVVVAAGPCAVESEEQT
ncbi:MAG: 3-deoxy-7-phosphoheptulonate synthase, partial [Metallosphaera sp.]